MVEASVREHYLILMFPAVNWHLLVLQMFCLLGICLCLSLIVDCSVGVGCAFFFQEGGSQHEGWVLISLEREPFGAANIIFCFFVVAVVVYALGF